MDIFGLLNKLKDQFVPQPIKDIQRVASPQMMERMKPMQPMPARKIEMPQRMPYMNTPTQQGMYSIDPMRPDGAYARHFVGRKPEGMYEDEIYPQYGNMQSRPAPGGMGEGFYDPYNDMLKRNGRARRTTQLPIYTEGY